MAGRKLMENGIISKAMEVWLMDLILLVPEKYLKKNKVYYLICDKGIYSNEVSAKLNKMGYNTHSIQGGYDKIKKNNSL